MTPDAITEKHISALLMEIAKRNTFFASLTLQAPIEVSERVPTAATDGDRIFVNPGFFAKMTRAEQASVLLHEVLHAALLHVTRRGSRDPQVWNIAADIVVNGIITDEGYPLPEGGVQDAVLKHYGVEEVYDKLFDKASGEFVNGIFVDVYISKGAESTWHKINEEILTGFSIGGAIRDSESVYNKSMGETVRIIKDYDLSELSVVDNPANPLSDFVSIQKFDTEVAESVEKNFLENVYWCPTSEAVIVSDKPDYACPECNKGMTNIGFVESNDTQKSEAIAALVDSIEKSHEVSEESDLEAIDKSIANSNEKEGNIVGFLNRKTTVVEEFVTKADEVVAEEAVVVEEVVEETEVVVRHPMVGLRALQRAHTQPEEIVKRGAILDVEAGVSDE